MSIAYRPGGRTRRETPDQIFGKGRVENRLEMEGWGRYYGGEMVRRLGSDGFRINVRGRIDYEWY